MGTSSINDETGAGIGDTVDASVVAYAVAAPTTGATLRVKMLKNMELLNYNQRYVKLLTLYCY